MIQLTAPGYTFSGPYAGSYALPEVAMDVRHVFALADVLRAWPFKHALELGSFNGASSTAFIEAINSGEGLGESGDALFCDVSPSDSLVSVVLNCRHPERVNVTPQPSWAVLDSALPFDFVLVDASHDIDSVSIELKKLLRRRPLCVMAHDTSATEHGYSKCEGAALLKKKFMEQPDYGCIEDAVKRPGERTERGLFLATQNAELLSAAKKIFAKWG